VALATFGRPVQEVRAAALTQAHVTHNNRLSDAATELVVRMVQQALAGGDTADLLGQCVGPLVAEHPEFRFRMRRVENPSGYVVETMRAVLQALFDTDTFESCLIDVVNRGGDADTTGAIAGMVAGALYGRAAIPSRWIDAVDPAITQACERQALGLIALSRSTVGAPARRRQRR
jgi:ADP-ribosyl-[dinitrogen reductase] hydrolase